MPALGTRRNHVAEVSFESKPRQGPVSRRRACGRFASLVALAASAQAQQRPPKLPRIALLSSNTPLAELTGPQPADSNARAFVDGLRELGWVDGRNVVIERRSAERRPERVPVLVREVIDLEADVIVTYGPGLALAAAKASHTIAIVAIGPDLVALGLANSLARPGGNVTGLHLDAGSE